MTDRVYDVVVVGCGPGGAVAARSAALNGARTLVVEKKRQIGFPIQDFAAILYSKSETERVMNLEIPPECIIGKAEELAYFSPSGSRSEGQRFADAIFIHHQLLERFLAMEAVRAGAEIMVHARAIDLIKEKGAVKGVVVRSGPELMTISCSVVISAEGPYGNLARMAGFAYSKTMVPALAYEFAGVKSLQQLPPTYEIYWLPFAPGYYSSVAPHGAEDIVSIGVSYRLGAEKEKMSLRERLARFISHLEKINRYNFDKASPVSMMGGLATPALLLEEKPPKLVSDGVMLIGDAGKLLFGSQWGAAGMLNAMFTGRLAAEVAAKAIKSGNVSEGGLREEYFAKLRETFKGEEPRVAEARKCFNELASLSPERQDVAIEEIGKEIAALHLYHRGALPLGEYLEPVKKWLGRG